jgi:hypothetical protein
MIGSHRFLAVLTSIAGLALAGIPAGASANEHTSQAVPVALADGGGTSTDISAQGRRGGGNLVINNRGGRRGGNVGRIGGRQGIIVPRTGGRVGRVGRVGRIGVPRIGRIGVPRVGYVGRYGRYGGRYGYRYGRVGFRPPIVVPVPMPGPGVVPLRATTPVCPVCPVQQCLIAIYSEPNLTGNTTETRDNQPRLDTSGWQNQISSVIIKGGTWDFFPELEYRGAPPLRLVPGSYPMLEPQWTKRIGSFMCVR